MMKKLFLLTFVLSALATTAQPPVASGPFELWGDHIFIKLSVDGSEPLDFILDTGDGLTVIDLDIAKQLQLALNHEKSTTSAQGSIKGALINHNRIDYGTMQLESNIKVYATSLSHLEISIGRNIDGIIGYDMLKHHVVRLNYDDMLLEFYDFGEYPTAGQEVKFKFYKFIPTIKGSVTLNNGETLQGGFYLNTGAGTTLDFNTPFAQKNGIVDKTGDHYWYYVKGLESIETKHYEGRVKELNFPGASFDNLPVGISQVTKGIQGDKKMAGIIGNRLLSRYNILIDYKTKRLYLDPNKNFDKPFVVNCSGLDVQMSKDMSRVLIHQVFDGSEAEALGIQENDELVSINGQAAMELSLIEIEDMLKKPGSSVDLVVNQNGANKAVTLPLKELL